MHRYYFVHAASIGISLRKAVFFYRPATKFLKFLHRLFFGKTRRHSIDLWPYLKLQYDEFGVIQHLKINNQIVPLTLLHQVGHASTPDCVLNLIATGPSIADIDYSHIRGGLFMGVNGAIELAYRFSLHFDYYVITDYTFVTDRVEIVAHVLSEEQTILFTTPKCLLYIYKLLGIDAIRCRVCAIEQVGKKYNQSDCETLAAARNDSDMIVSSNPAIGFSLNVGKGVYEGGTVAYVGLQIAAHLGYQKIYLHGIDLGNAERCPRFYETKDDKTKTHLVRELDSIILPSFRLAAPLLRSRGISVYNLSLRSSLAETIFKKIDVHSLYS